MEPTKRTYKKQKVESKVTVKHFLNTRLKGKLQEDGQIGYPLYIRLTAKGLHTDFKSQIPNYVSVDKFDSFQQEYKTHLGHETRIIEDIVKKLKPDDNQNFSLDSVSKDYESSVKSFSDTVESQVRSELKRIVAVCEWNHHVPKDGKAQKIDLDDYTYVPQLISDNKLLQVIDWSLDTSTILDALIEYAPSARRALVKLQHEYKNALYKDQIYKGKLPV
jgi:hypothetical protein